MRSKEATKMLGISRTELSRLVDDGKVRVDKENSKLFNYNDEDILALKDDYTRTIVLRGNRVREKDIVDRYFERYEVANPLLLVGDGVDLLSRVVDLIYRKNIRCFAVSDAQTMFDSEWVDFIEDVCKINNVTFIDMKKIPSISLSNINLKDETIDG